MEEHCASGFFHSRKKKQNKSISPLTLPGPKAFIFIRRHSGRLVNCLNWSFTSKTEPSMPIQFQCWWTPIHTSPGGEIKPLYHILAIGCQSIIHVKGIIRKLVCANIKEKVVHYHVWMQCFDLPVHNFCFCWFSSCEWFTFAVINGVIWSTTLDRERERKSWWY